MKKYLKIGFLSGIILAGTAIMFRHFREDSVLTGKLLYEEVLSDVEGYQELNEEEKKRIEELRGTFRLGEMEIDCARLDSEWYEGYMDELIGKEIVFNDINDIVFDGGHYQAEQVRLTDAEYYFDLRYLDTGSHFGKKSVVTIWFHSLDNVKNAFALLLSANGNIYFEPGEWVAYGHGDYTMWGMYEVIPLM